MKIKFQNKKNGKVAFQISHDDKFKTSILQYEDDSTVSVTDSTLKRWWKKIEEEAPSEVKLVPMPGTEDPDWGKKHFVEQDEDTAGDGTPLAEVGKEIAMQAKEKAKAATSKKEAAPRKKKEMAPFVQEAMDYIFKQVTDQGDEVFVPTSGINMRSFKVGGHMYTKFDFTCSSITIAVKSASIQEGVRTPDKTQNHMFDAVYQFKQELSSEDKDLINKLLAGARAHRILKNDKSKDKEEK